MSRGKRGMQHKEEHRNFVGSCEKTGSPKERPVFLLPVPP